MVNEERKMQAPIAKDYCKYALEKSVGCQAAG